MLLQYFLIISPVYCAVGNMPDSWNIGERKPLQKQEWRVAFEKGFKDFCIGRGGVGNLRYEASTRLFNILEKHVDQEYARVNDLYAFFSYHVGFGYNPIYHLDYYPNAFAKYIPTYTKRDANYTCEIFRKYPVFQCNTFSWPLSLYIYCIFITS